MGRMKKREAIAIIEAELRRQAANGQVSSKLVEQLVTIRGWSGKAKAARAKARAGKTVVQPAEVPLPELIEQAKAEQPSQPSPQPALQPHSQPSAVPPPPASPVSPPVLREALDLLCGITPQDVPEPAPQPSPRPQAPLTQVCPVSHFDFADRPVIVTDDHPAPESSGDYSYW